MREISKEARRLAREAELEALADGRRNRSSKFKTPKDYNRKDNSWRDEE